MDIFTRYFVCGYHSWLGMLCEYNLISHASAFSIRPHPLKVVTLFAHNFLRGTQTVREAFRLLPDVVGRSKNV